MRRDVVVVVASPSTHGSVTDSESNFERAVEQIQKVKSWRMRHSQRLFREAPAEAIAMLHKASSRWYPQAELFHSLVVRFVFWLVRSRISGKNAERKRLEFPFPRFGARTNERTNVMDECVYLGLALHVVCSLCVGASREEMEQKQGTAADLEPTTIKE